MSEPLKVGDKVLVIEWPEWPYPGSRRAREPRKITEGTVVKVGRKWATVEQQGETTGWKPWEADKMTGRGKPDRQGFGAYYDVYSSEGWAEEKARQELVTQLNERVRFHGWQNRLTPDQILRVMAVLDEADGQPSRD